MLWIQIYFYKWSNTIFFRDNFDDYYNLTRRDIILYNWEQRIPNLYQKINVKGVLDLPLTIMA